MEREREKSEPSEVTSGKTWNSEPNLSSGRNEHPRFKDLCPDKEFPLKFELYVVSCSLRMNWYRIISADNIVLKEVLGMKNIGKYSSVFIAQVFNQHYA